MGFLNPSVLGPLFRFNREYYELDERGRPAAYRNLEKLHERIKPYMLRRRKADVETELPERSDRNFFVPLSGEQQLEYRLQAGIGNVRGADLVSELVGDDTPAHGEDIGVVMLAGKLGRKWIVDAGAAAFGFTIDGNGNADPRSADSNAALGLTNGDGAGKPSAIFRVIHAFRRIRSKIAHLMPLLGKPAGQLVLEEVSGMIGGKSNAHIR
jgi:hypothetical protein